MHNEKIQKMLGDRIDKSNPKKVRLCDISKGSICHTGGGAAPLALALDSTQGASRSVDSVPEGFRDLATRVRMRSDELLAESIGLNVLRQDMSA